MTCTKYSSPLSVCTTPRIRTFSRERDGTKRNNENRSNRVERRKTDEIAKGRDVPYLFGWSRPWHATVFITVEKEALHEIVSTSIRRRS